MESDTIIDDVWIESILLWYKKRSGDYSQDKSGKDEAQQNLDNWGKEEWQTKDGSGEAKQKDGSRKRYLPKKAWEQMDENEKGYTDEKKQNERKGGNQFVASTGTARRARKDVAESKKEESEETEERPKKTAPQKRARDTENDGHDADEDEEAPKKKRGSGKRVSKTFGSKHDKAEAPAQQASISRLPKKGQQAHWKAMPGWVDGEAVEGLKRSKWADGKQVKASKEDPQIVLKSNAKSGKICVHKVDNVYFT